MSIPTTEQIRAAIVTRIAGIPDIGQVHDYERYAQREGDFRKLYVANIDGVDQLRGWFVRRVSMIEQELAGAGSRIRVETLWRIVGYMAIADADASEKAFDALIDAIVEAFRADQNLGGLVSATVTDAQAGADLEASEPVVFCGATCHQARMALRTVHYR